MIYPDGKEYEGSFVNEKKQGFGKLYWSPNQYYEGYWVNDKEHGEGFYFYNGKKLKGQFRFGKIILKN